MTKGGMIDDYVPLFPALLVMVLTSVLSWLLLTNPLPLWRECATPQQTVRNEQVDSLTGK